MKALILGAGYATRLYPLTKTQPKPLLPVAGRPMVEWILDRIEAVDGIDAVYLVSNDTFYKQYADWATRRKAGGKPLVLINDGVTNERTKLGAVGDIRRVIQEKSVDDDLLVVAGDNLFDLDLSDFISFYRKKKAPVIALKDFEDKRLISRYSVVTLDPDRRIVDFDEKPAIPKTSLISICLYLFPRKKLHLVDAYVASGGNPDAPGYYIQWLVKQTPAYGYVFDTLWFDIGDIDSYNQANAVFGRRLQSGRQ